MMFWAVVNVLLAYAAFVAICVAHDCRRTNQAAVKAVVDAAADTLCNIRERWEAAERRMTELLDRMEGSRDAPSLPTPAPASHPPASTDGWESDDPDDLPGLRPAVPSPLSLPSLSPSPTRGGVPLVR